MTKTKSGVRARIRRTLGTALSVCALAAAVTIIGGAPPAEAVSSGSMWYVGPNSPPEVANQVTYYGAPFGSSFYGLQIRLGYPSAPNGFTLYDDQTGAVIAEYPALWVAVADTGYTDSFSVDIPGAIITKKFIQDGGNGGGPGIEIGCVTNVCPQGLTSVQVSYTYSGTYRNKACVDAWDNGSIDEACPAQVLTGTQTRTVLPGSDSNVKPTASFISTQSSTDDFEWSFGSRSSDDQDAREALRHSWDFGDGKSSTEVNPTHRFERTGSHRVTLTVTDSGGLSSTSSQDITIKAGLVVNSTGDGPASDPAEGCDTGGTVGDPAVPECTLRAAIEAANADSGGEITFDIAGSEVPTIAATTALPALSKSIVVDGTSQSAGAVQLQATGDDGLVLSGGTSTVKGLSIRGAEAAVSVTGGSGHRVEGNWLGVDAASTGADSATAYGVSVKGANDVIVADNVLAGELGVLGAPGADRLQVTGNFVGVAPNGTTPLGEVRGAVVIAGGTAQVRDNSIRAVVAGVAVLSSSAPDAIVENNTISADVTPTLSEDADGIGVYVDAAPGATVSGNTIVADGYSAVLVSGSQQYTSDDTGIELRVPNQSELPGAVTGGNAKIIGNTIALADSAAGIDEADVGVASWAGAKDVTVSGNTVTGAEDEAVEFDGGSGHKVVGNTLGSELSPVGTGVSVNDADDVVVGATGGANLIRSNDYGVDVSGTSKNTRVEANTVTAAEDIHTGISFGTGPTDATIGLNSITGGSDGISARVPGVQVAGNTVVDVDKTGIDVGSSATVAGNLVTGSGDRGIVANAGSTLSKNTVSGGDDGIVVAGTGVELTENRVGLAVGSSEVVGNTGNGITVLRDDAKLTKNVVAGSGRQGIDVQGSAKATMRGNRVWKSTGLPIAVADGPDTPVLAGAIDSGAGDARRRTLVVGGLPEGDAGTLEVFANPSCGAAPDDGEAEQVLEITRSKVSDDTTRIVQIKGLATRDNFTVTYTDADGRTSQLSNCVSGRSFGDTDSDGSVDILDTILGFDGDPTTGIIATDDEDLLLVKVTPADPETGVGGGQLENLGLRADPAPGSHPAGWSLPEGVIGFRIIGLAPGARTSVIMTKITGNGPIGGTSYWKYGPPTPGAASRWFLFEPDETDGTGAVLSDGLLFGGQYRRAWQLFLGDGLRGDSDGGANGTITDPGGPVIGGDTDPAGPVDPPTPTTPTTATTAPPTGPTTTGSPSPSGNGGAAPTGSNTGTGQRGATAPGSSGELARTGYDPSGPVGVGIVLVLVGVGVLALRARLRPVVSRRGS